MASLKSSTKDYAAASVFRPEHLLREARRQRNLPEHDVRRTSCPRLAE